MSAESGASVADFLEANQVETWADIVEPGTAVIGDPVDFEATADNMIRNWSFDGELVPDRDELIAALRRLEAEKLGE